MAAPGRSVDSLPEMPRAANNNWQTSWSQPCSRLCCHTHPSNCPCADIGCDACMESIVRPKGGGTPLDRFVCLGCAVDPTYDESHWSTQLCADCFASATAPHLGAGGDGDAHVAHSRWLRIDGATGAHSEVVRGVARGVAVAEVGAADLTVFPLSAEELEAAGDCTKCWCFEIDESNPKAAPPGCTDAEHGCCRDGCLALLSAQGRLQYFAGAMPPKTYFCTACRLEASRKAEQAALVTEFDDFLRSIATGSVFGVASVDADAAMVAAAEALARAPSLVGRPFAGSVDADRFAAGGAEAEAALAEWAVRELKAVHALQAPGVNAHLHEALDARLEQLAASHTSEDTAGSAKA